MTLSFLRCLRVVTAVTVLVGASTAQHAQVSALKADPTSTDHIWTCNRDNNSVSLVDLSGANPAVTEIAVGMKPRSLAITADGSKVLVANQRGNVPISQNFVLGFPNPVYLGTVSVIDTGSMTVTDTLTDVGVEPYGIAIAPNGKYFAVSGFRSGTIKFYDINSHAQLLSFQYLSNLNFIPAPFTIADVDENRDGIADLADPRGFTIQSDSKRMYVTHHKSPFVSALDVSLDGNGLPTAVTIAAKIDTNTYPFDPFYNPTPVQTTQSQGLPRFLEDIALSPDGNYASVPHVLHNINHDVGHDFGTNAPETPLNRVYPALSIIDAANLEFDLNSGGSARLHHEHSYDDDPAEFAAFGDVGVTQAGDQIVLGGGLPAPILGGQQQWLVDGLLPGDIATLYLGTQPANVPHLGGTLLVDIRRQFQMNNGQFSLFIPATYTSLENVIVYAQVLVDVGGAGQEFVLSNALKARFDFTGHANNTLGRRAGQPSRVLYNEAGDHLLMLNRGSEDLFLFRNNANTLKLRAVFPERMQFTERAALDTGSPMGDLPLGMTMVPDPSNVNDDALVYVINEATTTLSVLRVNFHTGTVHKERDQISTLVGPDEFTVSERIGQELFEDASRPQTTKNFNNSCASCHFEGGEDGNVWQREAGPRSTMPVYGGTLGTGLLLWRGTRLNMGETGPMFGGENGGHGIFTDAEQQGLIDYHETIPFPLNPNLDPSTGDLTANAAFGKDLFFGSNDTGLNASGREAGCTVCHGDLETNAGNFPGPRFYTFDFIHPDLSGNPFMENLDPSCFSLRENFIALNVRNVNTGANVDADLDGSPDVDRNNDGYSDLETYAIMNADGNDDFKRDDPNGYDCPCTPGTFGCDTDGTRIFTRDVRAFSVPTKLGVFATGPYFHDHAPYSLRTMLNPDEQALSPIYGSPAFPGQPPYPGLNKIFNEEHDIIGHQALGGISDVQLSLQSGSPAQALVDMEAILAFIQSL